MAITINEPSMESRLTQEAAKRGLAPADYLRQLLELHLSAGSTRQERTANDWAQDFNTWVNSHPRREALPPEAFARASFYPEPA